MTDQDKRWWLVVEDDPIAGTEDKPYVRGPFGKYTARVLCKLTDYERNPQVIPAATATEAAEIYEQRFKGAAT
ncbi:MAG: hypothetical protein K9K66_04315 [Desulfarculaceae bacterium]|nr:hypothetical protein [Desulfarculaceae bacterium]MCF8073267.1 hypothetical protein [Desulfarculaceae bacterium]MCF8100863.1 hypothetical protein [Desulfarculaceae bacterium]